MGLFDGEPSAADLAQRFGLPVLAVVDASAMAGTFGALAYGLQHYRAKMPWAGVLANRVASARHADMLQISLQDPAAWMGAVMRNADLVLPERHLGLTIASEVPDALARLDAAADALATTPLGRMTLDDLHSLGGLSIFNYGVIKRQVKMMSQFEIPQDVVSRELEGEQVLLDMASGAYFGLNESGSMIWKLLLEAKSEAEITAEIVSSYDVNPEEATHDIEKLFALMQEKNLLKIKA